MAKKGLRNIMLTKHGNDGTIHAIYALKWKRYKTLFLNC